MRGKPFSNPQDGIQFRMEKTNHCKLNSAEIVIVHYYDKMFQDSKNGKHYHCRRYTYV